MCSVNCWDCDRYFGSIDVNKLNILHEAKFYYQYNKLWCLSCSDGIWRRDSYPSYCEECIIKKYIDDTTCVTIWHINRDKINLCNLCNLSYQVDDPFWKTFKPGVL